MKVFTFFTEPASYTLDLINNVHNKLGIDYCFIKLTSQAYKKFNKNEHIFLNRRSIYYKMTYLINIRKKYDLIIFNSYNNFFLIIMVILNIFSYKKCFIAIESDTQLLIPKNYLARAIKHCYLTFLFKNKYVIGFAGGNYSHKDLFIYYGMRKEQIFLMPMMVDNMKFYQKEKLLPKVFTFLYVGRLVKIKNIESLIEQFNKIFCGKKAILKIVGGGNEEEYLKNKYASNQVLFLGKLFDDDLIVEFQKSSCFVFPTKFEPWGLVVNEALSSGLPIITTKIVGANNDLIKGKETGIIALNMEDFGHQMLKLYNNPAMLMRFSKKATHYMRNHWNYALYIKCMNNVIKHLHI